MGGILLLEDGRSFVGEAFGAPGTRVGEVVFNTAMSGYQEVLTDPSYCEQIVVMTSVHVGNYGVNDEDPESDKVWVSGFVAREFSRQYSNHRAQEGLDRYLRRHGVPAVQGIDTRALVRHIREKGAMKAVVSTDGTPADQLWKLLDTWPGMDGRALATEVGTREPYVFADPASPRARVSVVDGGIKRNILRLLRDAGCKVTVHPITGTWDDWAQDADLVFFSNGPGDPAALPAVAEQVSRGIGQLPMVGICLGHQLLALGIGAKTYKLKYGHRGANHPVRDIATGRVEITSQNHGFCVEPDSLAAVGGTVTHVHLNDQTIAGFKHDAKRVMCVQFHPEASPGPHDSQGLIERFLQFAGA
ncbi:MAG: glutamine-hydrolyzing carbamoyl-phosphate synthase small subunit [Alphaproteobacteria bacterium]|nr:glutamine-hydrolyzing carbamoyl-phosphate synthase small subunit [Alphaproteobacteria bacterium]